MVDAGISGQAAVGGFELAHGSKPRLLGISLFGQTASSGVASSFTDGEGVTTNNGTGFTATVAFGAGSVTMAAPSAGAIAGTWILGTGNNDDDLDIFAAHGDFAARDGAAYVAAGTGALPGTLNVTSINGGTVSFIISCPHEDTDDLVAGDGYFINLFAYARGGV